MSSGPTTPYATVKHGDFKYVGYTGIFNVLDYAACSFPSGLTANFEKDTMANNGEPLSTLDSEVRDKCMCKSITWEVQIINVSQIIQRTFTVCQLVYS
jgi:hypothetical protein